MYQNVKKHVLTFLQVRTDLLIEGSWKFLFIQIDRTDPGRSVRWETSTCTFLSKHSSAKCSEQTMNRPWWLKFARWVLTNLAHVCKLMQINSKLNEKNRMITYTNVHWNSSFKIESIVASLDDTSATWHFLQAFERITISTKFISFPIWKLAMWGFELRIWRHFR